jgi:ubiquinone biosynthesis protein UbiJ
VNGHTWWIALAIGAASFAAGVLWSLHANDAAQTQQLTALEARAIVAREAITGSMDRLASLEREVALLKQRLEAMP